MAGLNFSDLGRKGPYISDKLIEVKENSQNFHRIRLHIFRFIKYSPMNLLFLLQIMDKRLGRKMGPVSFIGRQPPPKLFTMFKDLYIGEIMNRLHINVRFE